MSTITTAIALERLGLGVDYKEEDIHTALTLKRVCASPNTIPLLTAAARHLSKPMVVKRGATKRADGDTEKESKAKIRSFGKIAKGHAHGVTKNGDTEKKSKAKIRTFGKIAKGHARGVTKKTPRASEKSDSAFHQIESNLRIPGINAAPHEFLMHSNYVTKPRLLVTIRPGDERIVDLFRNPCRWHPEDVEQRLRGTFNTPNHAGERLLQTLRPSESGAKTRRTASARKCFVVSSQNAKTLIDKDAKIVDHLMSSLSASTGSDIQGYFRANGAPGGVGGAEV